MFLTMLTIKSPIPNQNFMACTVLIQLAYEFALFHQILDSSLRSSVVISNKRLVILAHINDNE